MKRSILFLLFVTISVVTYSQKDNKVIVTINGEKITVADFKKVYEKNLSAIDNEEGKDVEKNLDLFINYKLKVTQAYEIKLDTLKSYKREMETYKNQLTAPYLQDKEYLGKLIEEAYNRTKKELRASHVLVRLPKNFKPEDTLVAYNKIVAARKRILAGEDFAKVAKEVSEDPSAATNGGDLGYFSAFKMVYDFEEAAYTTEQGKTSQPFRTRFGYHIVQNNGYRLSRGERQVAHILITDTTANGKKRIDEAYGKLKAGTDFKELAKQYSNDRNTKDKGGVLPKFASGRMVKPFEDATFSLDNIDEYSAPFKTQFGWHIVKLIKKFPILSFEEMKDEISSNVKKSGRARLSDKAVLDRLKSEYKIEEIATAKELLKTKNIRTMSKDSLQGVLVKINEKEIRLKDFAFYILNRRHLNIQVLYKNFLDAEITTYFKENLVNTNAEYAFTLKEYEDGLLLFELMQQKIWNKSNDSISLKNYFDTNKAQYQNKDLSKVKGKVMNDYQTFLEDSWTKELRSKSDIKINKKVLKKLIKYYRKES